MSPLKIKMLLHYYACARDYRDEVPRQHACSSAVKEAIDAFVSWDLVVGILPDHAWQSQDACSRLSQYKVTDRGRAMVDAYTAVKLPIIQWVQP